MAGLIRQIGLAPTKAKNIVAMSQVRSSLQSCPCSSQTEPSACYLSHICLRCFEHDFQGALAAVHGRLISQSQRHSSIKTQCSDRSEVQQHSAGPYNGQAPRSICCGAN